MPELFFRKAKSLITQLQRMYRRSVCSCKPAGVHIILRVASAPKTHWVNIHSIRYIMQFIAYMHLGKHFNFSTVLLFKTSLPTTPIDLDPSLRIFLQYTVNDRGSRFKGCSMTTRDENITSCHMFYRIWVLLVISMVMLDFQYLSPWYTTFTMIVKRFLLDGAVSGVQTTH